MASRTLPSAQAFWAAGRRWLATACCLLTLAGSCEATTSLPALLGQLLPSPQGQSPAPDEDTNDDALQQAPRAGVRQPPATWAPGTPPASPAPLMGPLPSGPSSWQPPAPVGEHARRNGLGGPLLC